MSKLKAGQKYKITKIFTEGDVEKFAFLTGDVNPIHLNEDYARETIFGKRIVHGMLVSSTISTVIANHLPGPGTIYLSQNLNFRRPVFLGDKVTTVIEVIKIREDKPVVTLRTCCYNQNKDIVIEGEANVKTSN